MEKIIVGLKSGIYYTGLEALPIKCRVFYERKVGDRRYMAKSDRLPVADFEREKEQF